MKKILTLMLVLLGTTLLAQNTDLTGIYYQKESTYFVRVDSIHLSNKEVGMKNELVGSSVPCYGSWEFTQTKIIITTWCGEFGTSDGTRGEYNWKYTGIDTIQLTFPVTKQTHPNPKQKNYSIQHEADGFTLTLIK